MLQNKVSNFLSKSLLDMVSYKVVIFIILLDIRHKFVSCAKTISLKRANTKISFFD